MVLDRLKASDQVRVVLNNQKWACVYLDHHCILSHFWFSVSYIPRATNETFVPHEDHFEIYLCH